MTIAIKNGRAQELSAVQTASVCSFMLGSMQFALDIELVQEVAPVPTVLPVAMAHPSVRGLFTLRGALVSAAALDELLELPPSPTEPAVAIVVRHADGPVALLVDRVEGVLRPGQGAIVAKIDGDDPRVAYFVRVDGARTIPVLDTAYLFGRIDAARFARDGGRDA